MAQSGAERRRAAQSGAERRRVSPWMSDFWRSPKTYSVGGGIRNLRLLMDTPLRAREHDGGYCNHMTQDYYAWHKKEQADWSPGVLEILDSMLPELQGGSSITGPWGSSQPAPSHATHNNLGSGFLCFEV